MTEKNSTRRKIVSQSVQEAGQETPMTAETSEETSENGGKRRGRKPGPRQRFYIGAANKGDKLIMESVPAFSEEEAHKTFKEKFKLAAQTLMGPVSFFSGDQRQAQIKRVTVSLKSAREALTNRTGQQIECVFGDWICIGSGIGATTSKEGEQFEADVLFKLEPYQPVNPENKPKRLRLSPDEVVRKDALSDIKAV